MKVCYFGDYNPTYARNRVLLRGLKLHGIEVIECRTNRKGRAALVDLFYQWKKIKHDFDWVIVGYSDNRWIVPLAKLLTDKPVIWDAFYSLYDSWVHDRKLVHKFHPKAWYYYFLDWLSCHWADKILLDTNAHIDYFVRTFQTRKNKFIRILVGSDDSIFYPREQKDTSSDKFIVHFHGKFIPLQGVEYIIRAAKLLADKKDVVWQIIGRGQEYDKVNRLARQLEVDNVNFIHSVSYEELPQYISRANVCLGIFGSSDKTKRVIPNKVYEAAAMGKPIITADSPAIREVFTDGENIVLCKTASADSLAQAILFLKAKDKREVIGQAAADLFQRKLTPAKVVEPLVQLLKQS